MTVTVIWMLLVLLFSLHKQRIHICKLQYKDIEVLRKIAQLHELVISNTNFYFGYDKHFVAHVLN